MDRPPGPEDDGRLNDQEDYLRGVPLSLQRWKAPRPEWDHDHCAFCWAKFMEEGAWPDAPEPPLHEGWTDPTRYWWVCPTCYEDFRERFGWVE